MKVVGWEIIDRESTAVIGTLRLISRVHCSPSEGFHYSISVRKVNKYWANT